MFVNWTTQVFVTFVVEISSFVLSEVTNVVSEFKLSSRLFSAFVNLLAWQGTSSPCGPAASVVISSLHLLEKKNMSEDIQEMKRHIGKIVPATASGPGSGPG